MNNRELEAHNALVFSYLTLRKVLGILGIALPIIVAVGAWIIFQTGLQRSISDYYYTGMRNVFVGSLWATAFFLLAYKGYGRLDGLLGNVGCVAAVAITIFPTTPDNPTELAKLIGAFHLLAGTVFFGTLIIFSLFRFTLTDPKGQPSPEKLKRNTIYRVCGVIMLACIVLSALYLGLPLIGVEFLSGSNLVFWLEAVALVAFGVSWLTKGEAILQDQAVP